MRERKLSPAAGEASRVLPAMSWAALPVSMPSSVPRLSKTRRRVEAGVSPMLSTSISSLPWFGVSTRKRSTSLRLRTGICVLSVVLRSNPKDSEMEMELPGARKRSVAAFMVPFGSAWNCGFRMIWRLATPVSPGERYSSLKASMPSMLPSLLKSEGMAR